MTSVSVPVIPLDDLVNLIGRGSTATSAPKYQRLVEAFAECVISGRFKPGERVPTETKLAEHLPVSIGTIQKALSHLARVGLIVRNRRTGTYIAERKSQVDEVFVYRYRDPETGNFKMPFVRTLSVSANKSAGPWQEALAVNHCVRVDRLVWFDQHPPAYSSVYFRYEHGKVYLDEPLENLNGSSLHRMLIERFNLPTVRMEHSIGCRSLDTSACEQLLLAPGTIGTVWDIRDFSIHDAPLLFQRYQLPPGHLPVEITETYRKP